MPFDMVDPDKRFLVRDGKVFATVFPMRREGTSPGSLVAANMSISEMVMFASASTSSMSQNIWLAWRRAATSGTTPCVAICSICVCVRIEMSSSFLRRATDVSSQDDSKARRYMLQVYSVYYVC